LISPDVILSQGKTAKPPGDTARGLRSLVGAGWSMVLALPLKGGGRKWPEATTRPLALSRSIDLTTPH